MPPSASQGKGVGVAVTSAVGEGTGVRVTCGVAVGKGVRVGTAVTMMTWGVGAGASGSHAATINSNIRSRQFFIGIRSYYTHICGKHLGKKRGEILPNVRIRVLFLPEPQRDVLMTKAKTLV